MDTFEEYYVEEKAPVRKEKRRKVSPFADSPYESPYINRQQEDAPEEPAKAPTQRPRKRRRLLAVVCALAVLLTGCGLTALLVGSVYENRMEQMSLSMEQKLAKLERRLEDAEKQTAQTAKTGIGVSGGMSPGQIYTAVADSVVCITAYGEMQDEYGNLASVGSTGSGFIISQDGYVVTNYHVVQDMTELYVVLHDKTELEAELVGFDANADIAVLKAEGENLSVAQIGSSDTLQVGEQVVAIGYPLSSDTASMTVGYISAKDQVISTDGSVSNMLQTDAAINSGNSGGPLFNSAGEVIGITTAKFSGYSSSGVSIEGMGFAIPMDDVAKMIQDLCEYGYITGAYLGVIVRDVDPYVQAYGLPAGAYVDEVTDGLAADRAGVLAGDVITELGGYEIGGIADLTLALRRFQAGDQVPLTVWRNGQEVYLSAVLDEKPREEAAQETQPLPGEESAGGWEGWFAEPFFGMFPNAGE